MPLEGSLAQATGNSGFQLESDSSICISKSLLSRQFLQVLKLKVIQSVCMKDW